MAQGWSPESYLNSVKQLEEIGYSYIALGGLNRLRNDDIIKVVTSCSQAKSATTQFHLLGVSRLEHIELFNQLGVTSFDSSMPLRQAISDDKTNYHTPEQAYLAIRVPQTMASPRLLKLVSKQTLDQEELSTLEIASLDILRKYDSDKASLNDVLHVLQGGITYRKERDFIIEYKKVLEAKPWKECRCPICKELGIEVILLRNRERNLRRGFHNLYTFSNKLKQLFPSSWGPKHSNL
ncbi:tRNA-guanine transglycosylase DpdA [Pontibacter rugosus]